MITMSYVKRTTSLLFFWIVIYNYNVASYEYVKPVALLSLNKIAASLLYRDIAISILSPF